MGKKCYNNKCKEDHKTPADKNKIGQKKGKTTMKRIVNVDKEYRCSAEKAIEKFFNAHPELSYWKEQFEYMNEANVNHEINDTLVNGEKVDWTYSLWLDKDEKYTYIAVIERA